MEEESKQEYEILKESDRSSHQTNEPGLMHSKELQKRPSFANALMKESDRSHSHRS